ncbi:forkhead box protein J1-like [Athene cunicularia]|uniref:Forkhead box protein J1-like n=1 Tax=Athene cunicularia TaxID=194338 RepID=A0A663LLF9_ATHCN|nr:forkhead box protein J1-like [Athene cunicularia]
MAEGWPICQRAGKYKRQVGGMEDSDELDDSLTSLMWLQDFSIKNTSMGKSSCCPSGPGPLDGHGIHSFAAPCSPLAADPACMGMPYTPCKPISSSTPRAAQHAMATHPQLTDDVDYKTNPHIKPPYSYATLICMAMEASDKPHITLSAIYKWITDNFCYFRHADPTWQNSIRHNLSLNKCFIKVPREKGEPGKGGFWKLDPQYADRLKNGASKKRRMTPVQLNPAFAERAQPEDQCVASPAALAPTSKNILNINMDSQQLLKELEGVSIVLNSNPAGHKRKQPSLQQVAKVPRLSNSALLSQDEQPELGSLKGNFDWEAIFDTNLNGEFSLFEDMELTPPDNPTTVNLDLTADGQHGDCAQDQEQVLTEPNQNNLDFGEAFMATSLLQHPWSEETEDDLSNSVNIEQLFDLSDASLPADGSDWSSLASLI